MQEVPGKEEIAAAIEFHFSVETPLGPVHIRSTPGVITAIEFNAHHAERTIAGTMLEHQCARELQEYFNGTRKEFTIPIGQPGTEFQQRVWDELVKIPYGRTISYHDLAVRLGDPKCIRAAGTANGKNNIAIVVPCHRVIGSDGSLTGYAGGLKKKEWLLRHEGSMPGMNQARLF